MAGEKLRRQPPFRAEQLGSLLRPQRLLDVRQAIREKKITPEEAGLPAVEKEAVGQVVKLQQELGFKAVSSGEYTRTRFWGLFWDELQGTTRLQDAEASMFRLYHPDVVSLIEKDRKVMPGDSVIAGGKIRHVGTESNLHELRLVQAFVPQSEWGNIKLTMITPAVSQSGCPVSRRPNGPGTRLTDCLAAFNHHISPCCLLSSFEATVTDCARVCPSGFI